MFLTDDYVLLEVVLLAIIFMSLLKVLLQFIRQGIMVLLSFIKCYINLLYTTKLEKIFQPLQEQVIQVLIIFVLQQFLLMELPMIMARQNNHVGLLIVTSLIIIVERLPKFYQYVFNGSEERE